MIPILYKAGETDFMHNGIGSLPDVISCTATENRNGAYEAEFVYPITGALYAEIKEGCIFKIKTNETSQPQLFRIYKSSKPMNKRVTFYGEHISYRLSGIPIEAIEIKSETAQTALSNVLTAGIFEHEFIAQSDIDTLNSTSFSQISIRAALGGVKGSLLDTYGGEYEFDNFTVKLHKHRGRDTGIRIAYGKNLTDIKQDRSISDTYTAVYPYVKYRIQSPEAGGEPAEVVVTLPEKVIYSKHAEHYAHSRAYIKDFSTNFAQGEEITVEKLRSKAKAWAESSGFDMPSVSITVSFKTLWDSPEYAKYAILERVSLCDTLSVYYKDLGVSAKAKVIKTVYDVLKERYVSIELGDARSNFADTVNQSASEIENVKQEIKTQTDVANINLAEAIKKATEAITGQNGGYVVLNPANNPQEILVMDKPNISEAINIWRLNLGGLAHSSHGYNGPYEIAMTMDGSIVADFIKTGTLDARLIKTGRLQSANGASWIDMDTGRFLFRTRIENPDGSHHYADGLKLESDGTVSLYGTIRSTKYPGYAARIGPPADRSDWGAFTVIDAANDALLQISQANVKEGAATITKGATIAAPFLWNEEKTNRKGIEFANRYIRIFNDNENEELKSSLYVRDGTVLINGKDIEAYGNFSAYGHSFGLKADRVYFQSNQDSLSLTNDAPHSGFWINFYSNDKYHLNYPSDFYFGNGTNGGLANVHAERHVGNQGGFKKLYCGSDGEHSYDGMAFSCIGQAGFDGEVFSPKFNVWSERQKKENIVEQSVNSALSKICGLKFYSYDFKDKTLKKQVQKAPPKASSKEKQPILKKIESDLEKLTHVNFGIMTDEAPPEIKTEDGKGIDLYSYIGMVAAAVKELAERIDKIEAGGTKDENNR